MDNGMANLLDISQWKLTPYQTLVLGFAMLILGGALLLMLPAATVSGKSTPFIDALFTATSAVCVTGLVVVDTGTHWSIFGQTVIIFLIQFGGLGIMAMATLFAIVVRKKIQLRERLIMQEALNQLTMSGVVRLMLYMIKVTLFIEFIGGTILALRFYADYGLQGIYLGYWHAVSAFCNAGFDLMGQFNSSGMTAYVEDPTVSLIVSGLFILGGLGFTVISDVWTNRSFAKLSFHTKLVLVTTAVLIILGTIVIFALEYDNPDTLEGLSWGGKLLASYFHSVTPRTAGFNTLDTGKLESATLFFVIILMFIGASPASTGGGIKTTTFSALMLAVGGMIRGRNEVEVFKRSLSPQTIYKAFTVMFMAGSLVIIVTMILSVTENAPFLNILFEVVSAFGTVGLSTGLTPSLTPVGKLWIIITMFAGRVGPVTLALAIALRTKRGTIHYPEGRVMIG
jgi:trk system potassium uptake protein TrkH